LLLRVVGKPPKKPEVDASLPLSSLLKTDDDDDDKDDKDDKDDEFEPLLRATTTTEPKLFFVALVAALLIFFFFFLSSVTFGEKRRKNSPLFTPIRAVGTRRDTDDAYTTHIAKATRHRSSKKDEAGTTAGREW
jgi:hypothetical protein